MKSLVPWMLVLSGVAGAATVASITTKHATIDSAGATANSNSAGFATRWNSYDLEASYLVLEFNFTASDFGATEVEAPVHASLAFTHRPLASYTMGRFDIFYVENTSPSIETGSTDLSYNAVYGHGFDTENPPVFLDGLTFVATAFYDPAGTATINLDLSEIATPLRDKINTGSTIRFVISEGGDTTVAGWHGLASTSPELAPALQITAVPEIGSSSLFLGAAAVALLRRRCWV